ncbi:MAG: hypothetical protein RMK97_01515 [Sutterellaceae bacterium]|nr:hypothetical protein [Burkholderiaceae bacterium]MCX7901287.1 hypothetical protein [Burkholderiaceae bacterium]MDW8429175.1 hypothetical protein [Sutterellaceae bacterium]
MMIAFALAAAGEVFAQALDRRIPQEAARGRIEEATAWMIRIDGKTYRLAPGARFLTPKNLTVTPNMVTPSTPVRFVFDERGQVQTVWLLEPDERSHTQPVRRNAPAP